MQLHEALTQISEIRQRMAQAQTFRGFRAASAAFSGLVTFAGCLIQTLYIPDPTHRLDHYLALWIIVAGISAAAGATEIATRLWRIRSTLQRQSTLHAVETLTPGIIAGAMVTFVLMNVDPQFAWMLPGLWAIFFSLSLFSASRVLPRPIAISAGYYMIVGLLCLRFARHESALSPWTMAATFGMGQLIAAGVLYWSLERQHDPE